MRQVPRLGLLARLGFLGAAMVVLAMAAMGVRSYFSAPSTAAARSSATGGVPASPDVTGSLPPSRFSVGKGPVSGLPMPRFVSIKTDRVNVRQGPTRDHGVAFVFQRSGLPVEIVAEFENWRRIRDFDGTEGWILQSLLSGKRMALIAPWSKEATLPIYSQADAWGRPVALLEPKVLASVRECAGQWCRVKGEGFDGWIQQDRLWGAYPGERFD